MKQKEYPDWYALEEWCASQKNLPDSVPCNAREWKHLADQYDLVLSIAERQMNMNVDLQAMNVNLQAEEIDEEIETLRKTFGDSYKKSIFECVADLNRTVLDVWVSMGFAESVIQMTRFLAIRLPRAIRVMARSVSQDLVSVRPMSAPDGTIWRRISSCQAPCAQTL
jgi:hypothetical protein